MKITRLSIREALIQYAEKNNRPYFDISFVKYFFNVIKLNLDHPIKNDVIRIAIQIEKSNTHDIQSVHTKKNELYVFCNRYRMRTILSEVAGVPKAYIKNAMEAEGSDVIEYWERLHPFFDEANKILNEKRSIKHGTLTAYNHHKCRCEKCIKANNEYSFTRRSNLALI